MLMEAWCQHRPVVLSPDVIWMLICQQFSHYVNKNPEKLRSKLVDHQGKKELVVKTEEDLFSDLADWDKLIQTFVSRISAETKGGITNTLVADFSTTGREELIASEITLMDVVKPFFEYISYYAVCGIPSITLTGTPEDWRKVLDKTMSLEKYGLDWWTSELKPILEEFIKASEGNPDYWFWKDIVKKNRPRKIQGPSCGKRVKPLTRFDGWFLKFFPFDNDGRTPDYVTITKTMLAETVTVPLKYEIVAGTGVVLASYDLELLAGIVGITQDPKTFTMTPKIGWAVRTVKTKEDIALEVHMEDSLMYLYSNVKPVKRWKDGPLSFRDFSSRSEELPTVSELKYYFGVNLSGPSIGNTDINMVSFDAYMNKYSSWIDPGFKSQSTLKYLQTCFDFIELSRRRASIDYNKGMSTNPNQILDFHTAIVDSFISRIKEDTRQGQDSAAVKRYSEMVTAQLRDTPQEPEPDLHIHPKGFVFGGGLGLGSEFFFGKLNEYITPLVGFSLDYEIGFNRLKILLELFSGFGGKYKKDVSLDGYVWPSGKRIQGGTINASIGFTAYETQRCSITPFAGIGLGTLDYPSDPSGRGLNSDEISGLRFMAGISADYKLSRFLSLNYPKQTYTYSPFGLPKASTVSLSNELFEISVHPHLYVARTSFPMFEPAWSINAGVNFFLKWWPNLK